MADSQPDTPWPRKMLPLVQWVTSGQLSLTLSHLLEFWNLLARLRDRLGYHGLYEILDYQATLEILDDQGDEATLTRHQVIRFLQDNVVALHDHAWGDGELFAEYYCQPGIPVDFYEDGSRSNVLISLRETKNRGDTLDLWIQRVIRGGLRQREEWLETEIDHWMQQMQLAVIFPRERHCRRAVLVERNGNRTTALDGPHLRFLSDGRQELAWAKARPRLHELYTLKWWW